MVLPARLRSGERCGCPGGEFGPLIRMRRRNLHPFAHGPATHRVEVLGAFKGKRTFALGLVRKEYKAPGSEVTVAGKPARVRALPWQSRITL